MLSDGHPLEDLPDLRRLELLCDRLKLRRLEIDQHLAGALRVLRQQDTEDRQLLRRRQPVDLDRHVLRPRLAEQIGDVPTGSTAHETAQCGAQELSSAR